MGLTIDWSGIKDWEKVTRDEKHFAAEEQAAKFEQIESHNYGPCRWQREPLSPVEQIAKADRPICFRRLKYVSWSIATASFTVGIPDLTESNLKAFWSRYVETMNKTNGMQEFKESDLRNHIGLRTNAKRVTSAAWLLRQWREKVEAFRTDDESLLGYVCDVLEFVAEQGPEGTEEEEKTLEHIELLVQQLRARRAK